MHTGPPVMNDALEWRRLWWESMRDETALIATI